MNSFKNIAVIGLTGQSGAGKSTVSEMFKEAGVKVIDCDKISRDAAELPEFLKMAGEAFPDCVDENGLLRKKLGEIVFNSHEKLSIYCEIIFPFIAARILNEIRTLIAQGEKIVILDAPTLFESGMDSICKAVISVVAPFDVKLRRVLERDRISDDYARSRLSSQFSDEFFYERSDWIIVNDGGLLKLRESAAETLKNIRERFDV